MIISACKKEPTFSCDEDLNEYAQKTMSIHQTISRDSLATLGVDTQFAIFNSLHSLNKARIFKEKIELLLNDSLVSDPDKYHLTTLFDYLTEDIYDNTGSDSVLNNWVAQAYNTLSWDSLQMYSYVETWMTQSEIQSMHTIYVYEKSDDCVCNSRFACNFGLSGCPEGGCSRTRNGCGIVGTNPCKGTCAYWSN